MSNVILVDMLIGIMFGAACWLVGFVIYLLIRQRRNRREHTEQRDQ